jgi:peptide/nickel transport system substrate-binding protein
VGWDDRGDADLPDPAARLPRIHTQLPYADVDHTPDLATAKALVARSGTTGMTVGVYGPNTGGPFKPVVSYVASVLRELGYHPVPHLIPADQGFEILGNPTNKVQVGIGMSWTADYPDASTYFDYLFSCASVPDYTQNESHYCSPATDKLIAQAKQTELIDPANARILWSDIDQQIMQDSPVIPGIDHVVSTFVSSRVSQLPVDAARHTPDRPDLGQITGP